EGATRIPRYFPLYRPRETARTVLSPTRSGPEGSSRNESAPGRAGSHLNPALLLVAGPDAKMLLLVRAPIPKNPNIRRACACYSDAMDESETSLGLGLDTPPQKGEAYRVL